MSETTRAEGGPAFPVHGGFLESGMSLRDYFAGQALIAFMSSPPWTRGLDDTLAQMDQRGEFKAQLSAHCYAMADLMLKARAQ